MKNNFNPKSYMVLWFIVIILLILVGTTHLILMIGHGRWECTDYMYLCEKCEVEGRGIIRIENQELEYREETPNNMCRCTDIKKVCKTEVWTRHLKEDSD